MTTQYYRQGDVSLFPVARAFKAPEAPDGQAVLALGEATGHMHVLEAPGVRYTTEAAVIAALKAEMIAKGILTEDADTIAGAVIVEEPAELWHGTRDRSGGEHASHVVAPGRYAVLREREYTPAAVRRVSD